ncbi:DUF4870 domain-containing protein [Bacteroides fragilis]|uniref:DUF4870 domain-containing protein n=1 Tax=Bacteroides fragilis TaxID=817 RepID=UPI0020309741|nr:DUF4870 domain-containing protein [Bacteroides fragilis]MCM0389258.1 DUF4870 domain-containing protein [Bacteroides fragilis]
MDYEKLEQLKRLHDSGALNDEEFEKEKKKILDEEDAGKTTTVLPMGLTENTYLALMNFAMFIPYVGWIAPIVLWIMGKESSAPVNRQGKYILNWYISWFLYSIVLTVLFIIFMFSGIVSISDMNYENDQSSPLAVLLGIFGGGAGILLLLILGVGCFLCLLFPIIGGIKGLNGKTWKYPLSIPFFKVSASGN